MVTDGGKLIRMPVDDIRIAGRKTQGVILFRTAEDEKVVSVTKLDADEGTDEEIDEEGENAVDADNDNTSDVVTDPQTGDADASVSGYQKKEPDRKRSGSLRYA